MWHVQKIVPVREKDARQVIIDALESKKEMLTEGLLLFTKPKPYRQPTFETEIYKSISYEKETVLREEQKMIDIDTSKPKMERETIEIDLSKPVMKTEVMVSQDETKSFESVVSRAKSFEVKQFKPVIPQPTETHLEKKMIELQLSKPKTQVEEKLKFDTKVFKPIVPHVKDTFETRIETDKLTTIKTEGPKTAPKPKKLEKETIEIDVKGRQPKEYFMKIKPESLSETLLPKPTPYERQVYTVEFPDSEPEAKPKTTKVAPPTKPVVFKKSKVETSIQQVEKQKKPKETRVTSTASVTFAEMPKQEKKVKKIKSALHKPRPRSYDEIHKKSRRKAQPRSVSFDEVVRTDDSTSEAEVRRTLYKPSEITVAGVEWTASDADESTDDTFTKIVKIKRKQSPTPERLIIEGEYFPKKQHRRVRTRKTVRKRMRSDYRPVPYVTGPETTWVPDRKDVMKAVEIWARYTNGHGILRDC